jgi:hypothetical protein
MAVRSRGDRKAVFNVVQKLKDVGPDLPSPHMKSLKGRSDLFDVAPTARKPTLVTARAQKGGAIDHDEVSVVAASA